MCVSPDIALISLLRSFWLTYVTDYPRYPHSNSPSPRSQLFGILHTSCKPTRIDRVGQLWPTPTRNVVAQTGHRLFHGIARHEDLCVLPHRALTFHCQGRRLGPKVDGRQRCCPDLLRHASFPSNHERHTVLYHRHIHQETSLAIRGG